MKKEILPSNRIIILFKGKKKLEGHNLNKNNFFEWNNLVLRKTHLSLFPSFLCKLAQATSCIDDSELLDTFPVK